MDIKMRGCEDLNKSNVSNMYVTSLLLGYMQVTTIYFTPPYILYMPDGISNCILVHDTPNITPEKSRTRQ